jgi:hypothetical protein
MQDAWVAFARTGNPRTAALPDWEPFTATRRTTMLLDTTSCRAVNAPYETERRFWANAVPRPACETLESVVDTTNASRADGPAMKQGHGL